MPHVPGLITAHAVFSTACVPPDGTDVSWFHCYTPQQIRAAYAVDSVPMITLRGATVSNSGKVRPPAHSAPRKSFRSWLGMVVAKFGKTAHRPIDGWFSIRLNRDPVYVGRHVSSPDCLFHPNLATPHGRRVVVRQ